MLWYEGIGIMNFVFVLHFLVMGLSNFLFCFGFFFLVLEIVICDIEN